MRTCSARAGIALGVLLDQPLQQADGEGDAGRLDRLQVDRRQQARGRRPSSEPMRSPGGCAPAPRIGRIAEVGHGRRRRGDVEDPVGPHRHDAGPAGVPFRQTRPTRVPAVPSSGRISLVEAATRSYILSRHFRPHAAKIRGTGAGGQVPTPGRAETRGLPGPASERHRPWACRTAGRQAANHRAVARRPVFGTRVRLLRQCRSDAPAPAAAPAVGRRWRTVVYAGVGSLAVVAAAGTFLVVRQTDPSAWLQDSLGRGGRSRLVCPCRASAKPANGGSRREAEATPGDGSRDGGNARSCLASSRGPGPCYGRRRLQARRLCDRAAAHEADGRCREHKGADLPGRAVRQWSGRAAGRCAGCGLVPQGCRPGRPARADQSGGCV